MKIFDRKEKVQFIFDPTEDITTFELAKLMILPSNKYFIEYGDNILRHLKYEDKVVTNKLLKDLYKDGRL